MGSHPRASNTPLAHYLLVALWLAAAVPILRGDVRDQINLMMEEIR